MKGLKREERRKTQTKGEVGTEKMVIDKTKGKEKENRGEREGK